MNKMLVAVFDTEKAADAAIHALRRLHAEGDITLYATGVIAKDAQGKVSLKETANPGPIGTGVGLAVGSFIGLLGGPVGVAVGAFTGTLAGAMRDFWVAGVGLDFIEEAEKYLQPGKVAVIAEMEEDWVTPVDSALEAAGGLVFRRARSDVIEAQFDHDIAALKAEIGDLETEIDHANDSAKSRLQTQIDAAKSSLEGALQRAKQQVSVLQKEADGKVESLTAQVSQATGDAKSKLEARVKQVKGAYHARAAKLSKAWGLTKEAYAAAVEPTHPA